MPTPANALAVMAKAPTAGKVKTRLAPPLSEEQAAELYRALLLDQLDHLKALNETALYVAFDPPQAEAAFAGLLPPEFRYFPQAVGDLGARMSGVFDELWRRGHQRLVLIGSDLPPVPLGIVRQAFTQLEAGTRAVLGPSQDGGYYLVGLSAPAGELFTAMRWSHDRVLGETVERLAARGIDFALLPHWFDIDVAADIARLREIADPAVVSAMKRTRRWLNFLQF